MVDIAFAIAAGVCFLLACGCFLLHYVFEHQKKATKGVPSIKQVLPTAKQKSTSNFVRTPFAYCRVVA